jgi:hypothetical protein
MKRAKRVSLQRALSFRGPLKARRSACCCRSVMAAAFYSPRAALFDFAEREREVGPFVRWHGSSEGGRRIPRCCRNENYLAFAPHLNRGVKPYSLAGHLLSKHSSRALIKIPCLIRPGAKMAATARANERTRGTTPCRGPRRGLCAAKCQPQWSHPRAPFSNRDAVSVRRRLLLHPPSFIFFLTRWFS